METSSEALLTRADAALIPNYARLPVVMTRGQGSRLWDAAGREYVDLFAGFGGAVLGHAQPDLVSAVQTQARTLWHVGNQFHTEPQTRLAETIRRHAFDGRAFFCHGGADANEAAIKLARLRGQSASPAKWKVVSLTKSFHGRTLATIAATGNPAVREGFDPVTPGFRHVEQGDFGELASAIDDETAAVLMEPIQGEGGINLHPPGYVAAVRKLCDDRGVTLIFDEVWTGVGRTGRYFGHQHLTDEQGNVLTPDIMTLGKALGGGLPCGAMFARPGLAALLTPGTHGSTLGGNPIATAVAATVFDVIERDTLLRHATEMGDRVRQTIADAPRLRGRVREVRGKGLFLGIDLTDVPDRLVERALEAGVVINLTARTVVRVAPAINIGSDDLEQGLDRLVNVLGG